MQPSADDNVCIQPNAAAIKAISTPCCPGRIGGQKRARMLETLSCCSLGTGVNFREMEERTQWPGG